MVVTEPNANPNDPQQRDKHEEHVTVEVHNSPEREDLESDVVTPSNNNNNAIPGKLTPESEQSPCAECELANQEEKTSLSERGLHSTDTTTGQTTDQQGLPVPSTSTEIPTDNDPCATQTVTLLRSTGVNEHELVDTNSKEKTPFSQSSEEKPPLKTKLRANGHCSVSKTSGSSSRGEETAVAVTDRDAITKAFAPPAYEDVVQTPTQDRKSSTKSSGSVESTKAGSISSQKTDIGTTPGGGDVGGRHVSQRRTSSRFTITPSVKDPLRRVLENESPLTRHKVSAVSAILSESPRTPPHRVSTVSTAPSAAETGSLATRIPSSVSSIKEDDNCSILDEVFWSPGPFRALEQDNSSRSVEAEQAIQMEDPQDKDENGTPSKQQHHVRILVNDESVEREDRLYDHTAELKRRLHAAPRPIPNPKPNDYIMLSCVVTCCCNPFLGIVAMVCAFISNGSYQDGDVSKATRYSRIALLLSILGILMTTLIVLSFLIVYWPSERPDATPMND